MLLHQFNALRDDQHLRHLILEGACVGDRIAGSSSALLFQVGKSYVEVIFSEEGDRVVSCKSFENTDELLPYLGDINLNTLLS